MPELVVLTEALLAAVPGGTGRYTRSLAAAMARTAPAGWTVTGAVARHADVQAAHVEGVAGPRMLPAPPRALAAAWQYGLAAPLLWPGGDVVHAPTPLAPPSARRGGALVVTVHDTVPWTHPETLTARGARWHRAVVARALRRADAVLVPTRAVAAALRERVPVAAATHVIGHGVDPALLADVESDRAGIADRLRLPERYVLVVGTIEPRKGLDVLIEAMSLPETPDVPLVVIGAQGWGGVDPCALADEHGLPRSRLRLLGRVGDAELAVALRHATVLAAPSMAEGFGLPVLEAMAAGVPVVHSDDPAMVEVAGGAGSSVPSGSAPALAAALRTVLDDPKVAATMAEVGRLRAAQFGWDDAARAAWLVHLECRDRARSRRRWSIR